MNEKKKISFARIAGAGALAAALGFAAVPLLSGSARAADAAGAAESATSLVFSAGVTFATDYAFRGISQTMEDPAVQPWVELGYGMFYLGVWGSNIDFGPVLNADVEVDIYGGVRPTLGNVELDFGFIWYLYPGANDAGAELDYVEVKAGASVPVTDNVTIGGALFYSPDYTGQVGPSVYGEGKIEVALPRNFAVSAALGHIWFSRAGVIDYTTWNAGLSWTYEDTVTLDVRYHDTDLSVAQCGGTTFCDARVIGSVSLAFSSE